MSATAQAKRPHPDSTAKARKNRSAKKPEPRRTTVSLSGNALEIVERFQQATGLSLSEAISELIERTEPKPPRIKWVDGLPMADIPLKGKWITTEDVLRAEAEPW